jgi:hypothetical protein
MKEIGGTQGFKKQGKAWFVFSSTIDLLLLILFPKSDSSNSLSCQLLQFSYKNRHLTNIPPNSNLWGRESEVTLAFWTKGCKIVRQIIGRKIVVFPESFNYMLFLVLK